MKLKKIILTLLLIFVLVVPVCSEPKFREGYGLIIPEEDFEKFIELYNINAEMVNLFRLFGNAVSRLCDEAYNEFIEAKKDTGELTDAEIIIIEHLQQMSQISFYFYTMFVDMMMRNDALAVYMVPIAEKIYEAIEKIKEKELEESREPA